MPTPNRLRRLGLLGLWLGLLLMPLMASSQSAPPLPTAAPSGAPVSTDLPSFTKDPAVKIAPTRYETEVTPGETKRGVVDVFNVSTQPITIQPEVENARMVGEAGQLEFFLGDNPFKLNSFVKVDPAPFTLQPGEARRVAFAIAVPAGIYPGGYYGALFMRLVGTAPVGDGASVALGGRAGTLLLVTVPGEVQRQGTIERVTARGGLFDSRHELAALYRNTGNTEARPLGVAVRPTGRVKLQNTFGRTIRNQPLTGEIVFPGAAREVGVGISKPLWFGRYTVEYQLAAEPNGPQSVKRVSFWAFSSGALAALILALIAGTVITHEIHQRRRRRTTRARATATPQSGSLLDDAEAASASLDRPDPPA